MKKITCLFLAISFVLYLAGCASEPTEQQTAKKQSYTDVSYPLTSTYTPDQEYEMEQLVTPNAELTAKGCPNLSQNLQELYAGAQEMVRAFNQCRFSAVVPGLTREINGMNYLVVGDSRFPDYEQFIAYLQTLFTTDFITETLLTKDSCVQPSSDGLVCVIDAGVGDDITYAGHVFTVTDQTPYKIEMTATVYFSNDVWTGDRFYTAPQNPEAFTTANLNFTIVKTDNGWRFSKCPFIG